MKSGVKCVFSRTKDGFNHCSSMSRFNALEPDAVESSFFDEVF